MRNILFLLLCLVPYSLAAQTVDSVALRQVDSLLNISKGLIDKNDLANVLDYITAAENIALEKLGPESAHYGNACFYRATVLQQKGVYKVPLMGRMLETPGIPILSCMLSSC